MCLLFRNKQISFKPRPKGALDYEQAVQEFLKQAFPGIQIDPGHEPSASISFMNKALVVPNQREDALRGVEMGFGIIPHWSKDGKTNPNWANARSESIHEKPLYKSLFKKRRCLVPVTGHYEFKKDDSGKSQCFLASIYGPEYYFLAGVWSSWKTPEGEYKNTFALVTREPNDLLSQIHDRQPVIVKPEYYDLWLEPGEEDETALKAALGEYPPDDMIYWPMDKYVNSVVVNKEDEKIVPSGEMVTY